MKSTMNNNTNDYYVERTLTVILFSILIHILSSLVCYFSFMRQIVPIEVCFVTSLSYSFLLFIVTIKSRTNTTSLMFLAVYSSICLSNCLLRFYDQPEKMNEFYTITVLMINGPVYGIPLFLFGSLPALYFNIILFYSFLLMIIVTFTIRIAVYKVQGIELDLFKSLFIALGIVLLLTIAVIPYCRFDYFTVPQYYTFLVKSSTCSGIIMVLSSAFTIMFELCNRNCLRRILHYALPIIMYLSTNSALYSITKSSFEYSEYYVNLSASYLIFIVPISILVIQIVEDYYTRHNSLH